MADPDFNDGFDKGKRAVTKAAGWVAGIGAAAVSPIARVAESKRQAADLKRQQEERAWVAHQQRTIEYKRVVANAELRPLHIVHVLSTIALAIFLAVLASLSPSPDRWIGEAGAFVLGIALGILMTWYVRARDIIRARNVLYRHVHFGASPHSVVVFIVLIVVGICIVFAQSASGK